MGPQKLKCFTSSWMNFTSRSSLKEMVLLAPPMMVESFRLLKMATGSWVIMSMYASTSRSKQPSPVISSWAISPGSSSKATRNVPMSVTFRAPTLPLPVRGFTKTGRESSPFRMASAASSKVPQVGVVLMPRSVRYLYMSYLLKQISAVFRSGTSAVTPSSSNRARFSARMWISGSMKVLTALIFSFRQISSTVSM